ncbi:hypothetical protein [Microbulbifer sp. SSSA005]|uniref:hypothetical protein n=1 Tax=Microbulbifer sp. SSSA005 TaxID=3243378 RepID=UPI00403A75C2
MKMISLTEVLSRPTWNRRLINELLDDPDEIKYRSNGAVHQKSFSFDRVVEAEKKGKFKAKEEADLKHQQEIKERADEIKDSLLSAIAIDINALEVPKTGEIDEVFKACRKQMRSFDSMMRVVDMEAYRRVYSPHSDKGFITPDMELYRLISEQRKDLAFKAGRRFQLCYMNVSQSFGWSDLLAE